jgi:uncharacterized protein
VNGFLLDVNALIALVDPNHVHHDSIHEWFELEGSAAWATCPLTENGLLRIIGHPKYPGSPGSPADVAGMLLGLRAHPGHRFWSDTISIVDPTHFDRSRLLSSGMVTDSYLLALAKANGGMLATFDRRLVTQAVVGGTSAIRQI